MSAGGAYARRRVEELAAGVERGAALLEEEAADLTGRGDPAERAGVAARKLAAARDLRAYAEGLRTGTGEVHVKEVQMLARAGACGGILLDNRHHPMPAAKKVALESLTAQGHMVRIAEVGTPFYALAAYRGWYEAGGER